MQLAKHLNPKIFDNDIERIPNRDGFGDGLVEAGEKNPNVIALSADLTESTRVNLFAEKFPERFVQCGVAEQNMASVASGLAAVGKIPFIASYAMFSPGRSWEQIRTTIAYNDQNVKVIGAHSGVSVGPDGATHQAIEDIAIMRVIPNIVVIAPADIHEAKKAVLWAADYEGPVYIRLGRSAVPVVTTKDSPFEFGKGQIMVERTTHTKQSVGIISTGSMLHNAILAAKELNDLGVGTSVLHIPTIKPLDEEAVLDLAETHDLTVTVEEHQRSGGLGGAVAEFLSEKRPTKQIRIGVDNQFGQSGEPDELVAHYKMDKDSITKAVREVFSI
ncbi:transketolase [Candidatus Kaiserbacteria bacterium CG10_big_fil_rev_8_21_14_0_10_44_10]|uniref:Transketolase n=1 Tax=Candidatus Kaiserbacteria bacterium CG10_big_fil_rev_8_21_14_0_10_44_10 TaxID=1974606 RepID=A0A2H0UIE4_9BACT|nr:MAG: transketolase [Candidatus Kaiserbacteria bacterium CG10_big_fil_rev_8_21_14_0_10_44_10]